MNPRHCFPHSSSVLNLADASKESFQDICGASNVAGIGLGDQNRFDETYRQSKKLDTSQSFCSFDPRASEISTKYKLISLKAMTKSRRSCAPNCNVKETFKTHKDTHSAENVMGSLVVVFPTVHQDGSLVIRQDEQGRTFCAEQMFSDSTPEASYFAFYSEVEHEVLPVASAVPATLTYIVSPLLLPILSKLLVILRRLMFRRRRSSSRGRSAGEVCGISIPLRSLKIRNGHC
ncbi:hypothetical protein EV421DRAFT_1719223 [Armillaria borealis]|uniref:Prolyl 4-hydroxylase alpha subunit Fe(2+) 2OG dioxygenase domain-containing protein n=1 Tax=Armillaria borealis TaxID=47425 RepID=A0AA39MFB9_9AGAR|nr:hypothetical protein EV421DRAFT_1719223 [Armillaria borealis]